MTALLLITQLLACGPRLVAARASALHLEVELRHPGAGGYALMDGDQELARGAADADGVVRFELPRQAATPPAEGAELRADPLTIAREGSDRPVRALGAQRGEVHAISADAWRQHQDCARRAAELRDRPDAARVEAMATSCAAYPELGAALALAREAQGIEAAAERQAAATAAAQEAQAQALKSRNAVWQAASEAERAFVSSAARRPPGLGKGATSAEIVRVPPSLADRCVAMGSGADGATGRRRCEEAHAAWTRTAAELHASNSALALADARLYAEQRALDEAMAWRSSAYARAIAALDPLPPLSPALHPLAPAPLISLSGPREP